MDDEAAKKLSFDEAQAYVKAGRPHGLYHWKSNYFFHLEEIVGIKLRLRSNFKVEGVAAGATLLLCRWSPAGPTIVVTLGSKTLVVPKWSVERARSPAPALVRYVVQEDEQQEKAVRAALEVVAKFETKVDSARKNLPNFKLKPEQGAQELRKADLNLADAHSKLQRSVDSLALYTLYEIRFNQFDDLIMRCTKLYNQGRKVPLEPALVKSILFEESKCGLNGSFIHEPPANIDVTTIHSPWMQNTNLMQAIDSSADQALLMIKEMASPARVAALGGGNIADLWSKFRLGVLEAHIKKGGPLLKNAQLEQERRWNYPCGAAPNQNLYGAWLEMCYFRDTAGRNVLGNNVFPLWNDYEYWVRTGIRWLWKKFDGLAGKDAGSWQQAVKVYNGKGDSATNYAARVVVRAQEKGQVVVSAVDKPAARVSHRPAR